MTAPKITIEDGYYYAPFMPVEFPDLEEGYLSSNVRVHFEFGPHEHADHFDSTAALLREADVYIPEMPDHVPSDVVFLRAIARSNPSNFEKLKRRIGPHGFRMAEALALTGTYMNIVAIDSQLGEVEAPNLATRHISSSLEKNLSRVYLDTLECVRNGAGRDPIMVKNLGPRMAELLRVNEKLRRKDLVIAIARLGGAHKPAHTFLADNSVTCEQVSASEWSEPFPWVDTLNETVDQDIRANRPVHQDKLIPIFLCTILDDIIEERGRLATRGNRTDVLFRDKLLQIMCKDGGLEAIELVTKHGRRQATAAEQAKFNAYLIQAAREED